MRDLWFRVKAAVIRFKYKYFLKEIFFLRDPEFVHEHMVRVGHFLGKYGWSRGFIRWLFYYEHHTLEQKIAGMTFKNPVGLAAGFDKDAYLTQILPEVGFGFEEAGSITGVACDGNPKPWLWRLPKSRALVVNYGLKNEGSEVISARLKKLKFKIPLGISLAKANSPDTVEEARGIADYVKAYKTFVAAGVGDYFTVNISCPNAFGGEPFVDPDKLGRLLLALSEGGWKKPVFIKMPSDIEPSMVDSLLEVSRKYKITGFICTNLTKKRDNGKVNPLDKLPEKGGISGKVVEDLSNQLISYIYKKTGKEFVIIGCGGVFSAEDAYKKIRLGASLIQMITGMIFEGPEVIGLINHGLANLLKKDGFASIIEAVGADFKSKKISGDFYAKNN